MNFTTAINGNRYNSVVNTSDLLNLLNGALGTNYKYSDIDVASATSQNGCYSTSNLSVGSATTIIAYRQNSTNSRTARHVRIIQPNASATSTSFAFYTVNLVYPDGSVAETFARAGTSITLPDGNGFSEGASAIIRNVSQQSVKGSVNENNTGLSRVVQFKGWKVGSTDTILQTNTNLVWEELLKYADGATMKLTAVWEYSPLQTATFFIRFDSVAVKAEDLNSREYAIRWYVFKAQDDDWHIDGKLVKKEGLIHVYKTFAGNKELIAEAKKDFYIDAYNNNDKTHTYLYLNDYTSYDSTTDNYMWEIENVDYGELWDITEYPHMFDEPSVTFSVYSEYTVMDALGSQSITGTGTSLTVSGMTYALDEGLDEVLRAEFTNIYNKSDYIIIKKQDALTGVSIGGATFQLLQNGETLKFIYDAESDSYKYDSENGTETILKGTVNGYFEISIENFSYEMGNIVVREINSPDGYTPIGDIEIPKISVSLIINHSIDEDVLQNAIGHVEGTSLPIGGINTHYVLAGHTDLPSAKLLTNIDHLKIGDDFYLHILDQVLEYQIDDISSFGSQCTC